MSTDGHPVLHRIKGNMSAATAVISICFFASLLTVFLSSFTAEATIIDDLKRKIEERSTRISELEDEIRETAVQINEVQKESKSLSSTIATLDLTRKKLLTDIEVTRNRIESSTLSIEKLEYEIEQTNIDIFANTVRIENVLQEINEIEDNTFMEVLLSSDNFSAFWDDIENMNRFREIMRENLRELEALKVVLQGRVDEQQRVKKELLSQEATLSDQKSIVDSNKREKATLLSQTKNKESEYKKSLKEMIAAKEAFEAEMADLESQLQIEIDRSKLPTSGSGVLGPPLPDVSYKLCGDGGSAHKNCLTQEFGDTEFAQSGAYNGKGHNGIDFRASVGTPIYAAESGTIAGTGDTDKYKGCYSYGQWILVTHNNGLSTLYAHLSLIKVSPGQVVSKGDLIGYSGNTGYSTGPHLHLTVYASEGVRIVKMGDYKRITSCTDARIPVAPHEAYLNPLDYF